MMNRVGESTLPCGRQFLCFLYLLRSFFSFTYSVLFDSKFWMTLQSLLSCVSVWEVYGALCRTLQTGRQKRLPWSFLPGSHDQCIELDSTVDLNMIFQVESRPVPCWVVLQWYALFCSWSSVRIVCTCGTEWILASSFWISQSFAGFNMAMILAFLHIIGIVFWVKQLLSIANRHLGPRFFSCSTSTSSIPAALFFSKAAIPLLYSYSLNG